MGRASHPGEPAQAKPDATLYQRIDQSLAYLYFIVDQPLNELERARVLQQLPTIRGTLQFLAEDLCPLVGRFPRYARVVEQGYLRMAQADAPSD